MKLLTNKGAVPLSFSFQLNIQQITKGPAQKNSLIFGHVQKLKPRKIAIHSCSLKITAIMKQQTEMTIIGILQAVLEKK